MNTWIKNGLRAIAFAATLVVTNALLCRVDMCIEEGRFDLDLLLRGHMNLEGVRILFLGDSHTMTSLCPDIIEDSRNLAAAGEGYMINYYRLAGILKSNPRGVRCVLLPLDPVSFETKRAYQNQRKSRRVDVDYFDLTLRRGHAQEHFGQFLKFNLFPYADLPTAIHNRVAFADTFESNTGFLAIEGSIGPAWKHARKSQSSQLMRILAEEWWCNETAFFLERILAICRDHEVQAVLVRFPIKDTYRQAVAQVVPPREFDRNVQELLQDWPEVSTLDYRDVFSGQEDLFWDATHLNRAGAEAFSRLVRGDLVDLGVVPQAY